MIRSCKYLVLNLRAPHSPIGVTPLSWCQSSVSAVFLRLASSRVTSATSVSLLRLPLFHNVTVTVITSGGMSSSSNSSSYTGSGPTLTLVFATRTLLKLMTQYGLGTSLRGSLCASEMVRCRVLTSLSLATLGDLTICGTQRVFRALHQSSSSPALSAAR